MPVKTKEQLLEVYTGPQTIGRDDYASFVESSMGIGTTGEPGPVTFAATEALPAGADGDYMITALANITPDKAGDVVATIAVNGVKTGWKSRAPFVKDEADDIGVPGSARLVEGDVVSVIYEGKKEVMNIIENSLQLSLFRQ